MQADGSGGARQQAAVARTPVRRRRAATGRGVGRALALGGVVALEAGETERVTARQLARLAEVLRTEAARQHVVRALRAQDVASRHRSFTTTTATLSRAQAPVETAQFTAL